MKNQIKNRRLPFLLLAILLFVETGAAQVLLPFIFINEREVDAASTQIAVRIPDDSKITRIRLNGETDGSSAVKNVSAAKSFLMTVALIDGENVFNIVAYAGNKIDSSTENPIVIVRKKSATPTNASVGNSSSGSVGAFSFSPSSNAGQSTTGTNQANDKRLRLVGKGNVKNQETYDFVIDASNMPPQTGNYTIEIRNTDDKGKETVDSETRKIEFDAGINRHKQMQSVEIKLREGKNTIAVLPRVEGQNFTETARLEVECVVCKDEPASSESVVVRAIVGLEQVGASSARSEQRPFLSLFFNTPVNAGTKLVCPEALINKETKTCLAEQKIEKPKFTFSVWGDIRMTTTPVQSIGSLANFTPAGFASNFVQGDSAGKVNDLVRSFDFLVGFDKEIVKPGKRFDGVFPGRTSLSFIAAGGAITPLSSDKGALFFKVPTETELQNAAFFNAFPEARGKKNIAFVASERSRFFRQYYAGFRLKTFFDDKDIKYVPAMFDVTFGQNEAITNRLQGIVMRLDGSAPFPISKAGFLYLFGSVNMRLGRSKETVPAFFLDPATNTTLTSADTIVLPLDRAPFQTRDRDVFRFGVGVDVFKLFKKEEPK